MESISLIKGLENFATAVCLHTTQLEAKHQASVMSCTEGIAQRKRAPMVQFSMMEHLWKISLSVRRRSFSEYSSNPLNVQYAMHFLHMKIYLSHHSKLKMFKPHGFPLQITFPGLCSKLLQNLGIFSLMLLQLFNCFDALQISNASCA